MWTWILVAVIVVLVAVSVWLFLSKRKAVEKFEEYKTKVILIHAKWCHYCRDYIKSGTFEKASNTNTDASIVFESLDYDENRSLIDEKYNVNSFPTIIAVDGTGKLLRKFSGNRDSVNELLAFAKQ